MAIVAFPVYLTLVASTQTAQEIASTIPMSLRPGTHLWETYKVALFGGETAAGSTVPAALPMMGVSLVMALVIAIGKIAISLLSAFAIVYFRFPLRNLVFWMIFVTLMLPVEVRIGPTYEVVSKLGMLNSYAGLTIPLIASATATFLFRQFFLTVPDELVEAARVDGAGPMQTDSSAMATCLRLRSTVECTATVRMPSAWQARRIRNAISPRLAITTLSSMGLGP